MKIVFYFPLSTSHYLNHKERTLLAVNLVSLLQIFGCFIRLCGSSWRRIRPDSSALYYAAKTYDCSSKIRVRRSSIYLSACLVSFRDFLSLYALLSLFFALPGEFINCMRKDCNNVAWDQFLKVKICFDILLDQGSSHYFGADHNET